MARQVFTLCSSLAINCVLYQEAALINLWGAGIYYDGATCWDVNSSGVIIGTAVCTTSTTTTTTTASAYELYTADRYECDLVNNVCVFVETIEIGNPSVLVQGKFYFDSVNSYIFNIVSPAGAGPYLITSMSGLGTNNCYSLCSV
jgi:hypothetical protein